MNGGSAGVRLWIPLGGLIFLVGLAVIGPLFTVDPDATSLRYRFMPVGSDGHLLGTDGLGRDLLSRSLHGGRVSLLVGFSAVAVGLLIGGGLGVSAGYVGGRFDALVMRLMDIVLAFPALILALAIAAALGPSARNVVIAVAVFVIPTYARLARATTMGIRNQPFVVASRFLGASSMQTVRRHVLPNVILPLAAYGMLATGLAMIVEAALSFLGLGVRPPQSTWGVMIAEGRADMNRGAAGVVVPGTFLFLCVLLTNLLGDELRRRSDLRTSVLA